ncbi:hypothetical protein LSH36_252g02032 [Paralvinella palmiformis]|uniref:Uncharacterized protein n=1 Tax=Paralvinella palmiformis TaxID=53620 RepID=A0AAD9N5F2_9ANNE|nr:hypothetical protein LSH36_252g02032 [Paralvinella palmiformis]
MIVCTLSHFITSIMLNWLFFLILPVIVQPVFSGYLKSTSDIKILEGETCVIEWLAYNNEEHTPPCSWWYAAEKSKEALTFLAYKNGKTYIYGRDNQWHFTNITNPCAGGLTKKMINIEDAGVYTMQTENGNLLRKEEAETLVEVLKGSNLNFSVFINDKVNKFDLGGDELRRTLGVFETDSPVSVSVELGEAFPSTTLTITSNLDEVSCDHPKRRCDLITSSEDILDVSVVIKIETGIIGANQIIITQPLTYCEYRGIKGYVFMMLDEESGKTEGKKMSVKRHIKKTIKDGFNDLIIAFNVDKQTACNEFVKGQDQTQHEQHEVIKSQKECISETMKLLTCIKSDLERYAVNNMQEELKISDEKDDIEEAEEAKENTSLLNLKDVQEQYEKITNLSLQQLKLENLLAEITSNIDYFNEKKNALDDAQHKVREIKERFEKIKKGNKSNEKDKLKNSKTKKCNKSNKKDKLKNSKTKKW